MKVVIVSVNAGVPVGSIHVNFTRTICVSSAFAVAVTLSPSWTVVLSRVRKYLSDGG